MPRCLCRNLYPNPHGKQRSRPAEKRGWRSYRLSSHRLRVKSLSTKGICSLYTLLTTCPPYGSQNVGDLLIEQRTRDLVEREKGPCEFTVFFREESLDSHIDQINRSRAVLLPGFPVRDRPMYPGVYRLVEELSRIRVPLIPIGANWNVYPGDTLSRSETCYSPETVNFLRYIAGGVEHISCREYFTSDILRRHGIDNTLMTGDPAWFLIPSLGQPMRRPSCIERLVFSPPLSCYYQGQAGRIMSMLTRLFPRAERYCAFHLFDADTAPKDDSRRENSAAMTDLVTQKNRAIRKQAAAQGFRILEMAGAVANLDFYEQCDLHVGYECHAHLNFFSRRIPSVLIAEDARGVGFNDTLGVGGFDGFRRVQQGTADSTKTVTSGYCTTSEELALAPPRDDLQDAIEDFLVHELESHFRRYRGLAACLDEIYETRMRPFIKMLP